MNTLLGQYEILSELGSGGMGVVYRALDIELQREVALKRLRSEFAASPAVLERFRREAQLQGRLNHPNIAQLYSLAQTPDAFCIVMELIDGVALKTLIPMSWQKAVPILLQALDGLGYAHSQGVLHRDIKPENILIDQRGTAKVMDFGIAHAVGAQRLTREKALIGTIEYMPPERIQGGQVDNRSDIYSIGMVLFEVLTGRLPYSVTSEYEVMKWHVESAPPPLSHFIQAPAALDEIVQKASAKRPEDRYASCEDMAAALKVVCATASPDSRMVPAFVPSGFSAASRSVPAVEPPLAARPAAPTRLVDPQVSEDSLPQRVFAVEATKPAPGKSTGTGRRRRPWKLIAGGAIVLVVVGQVARIQLRAIEEGKKQQAKKQAEQQADQRFAKGNQALFAVAKGDQALLQKNYGLASEYFHKALTLDPGNSEASHGLRQIQEPDQAKAVRETNLTTEKSARAASASGVGAPSLPSGASNLSRTVAEPTKISAVERNAEMSAYLTKVRTSLQTAFEGRYTASAPAGVFATAEVTINSDGIGGEGVLIASSGWSAVDGGCTAVAARSFGQLPTWYAGSMAVRYQCTVKDHSPIPPALAPAYTSAAAPAPIDKTWTEYTETVGALVDQKWKGSGYAGELPTYAGVRFSVAHDGLVGNPTITKSSGSRAMDAACKAAVGDPVGWYAPHPPPGYSAPVRLSYTCR